MSNTKKSLAFVLVPLIILSILTENARAASTFNVLIWQQMSLESGTGYTSGYTNNSFVAVIGNCTDVVDDICIESVEMKSQTDVNWQSMTPKRKDFNSIVCRGCTGQTYGVWKRDNRGLPTGDLPSEWSTKDTSVVVQANVGGKFLQGLEVNRPDWNGKNTTFEIKGMSIEISSPNLEKSIETLFRITINLRDRKEAALGFFDGRMRESQLGITSDNRMVFEGKPTIVTVARTKTWNSSEIPDDVIDFFKKRYIKGAWIGVSEPSQWRTSGSPTGFSFSNDFEAFDFFEKHFSPDLLKDQVAWSVSNIRNSEWFQGRNQCFDPDETSGLATTNANMYGNGVPEWNESTTTLDFRMASPHLNGQGNLTIGNYDLVLRESTAKCIWKIKDFPKLAELKIDYPDGVAQIATVVLGSKDGFISFHANGFHFSSPTVKVKIATPTPTATPTPVPTVSPTPSPTPKNKVTIRCKLGKKVIIKTGVNVKCPQGYKKVS